MSSAARILDRSMQWLMSTAVMHLRMISETCTGPTRAAQNPLPASAQSGSRGERWRRNVLASQQPPTSSPDPLPPPLAPVTAHITGARIPTTIHQVTGHSGLPHTHNLAGCPEGS